MAKYLIKFSSIFVAIMLGTVNCSATDLKLEGQGDVAGMQTLDKLTKIQFRDKWNAHVQERLAEANSVKVNQVKDISWITNRSFTKLLQEIAYQIVTKEPYDDVFYEGHELEQCMFIMVRTKLEKALLENKPITVEEALIEFKQSLDIRKEEPFVEAIQKAIAAKGIEEQIKADAKLYIEDTGVIEFCRNIMNCDGNEQVMNHQVVESNSSRQSTPVQDANQDSTQKTNSPKVEMLSPQSKKKEKPVEETKINHQTPTLGEQKAFSYQVTQKGTSIRERNNELDSAALLVNTLANNDQTQLENYTAEKVETGECASSPKVLVVNRQKPTNKAKQAKEDFEIQPIHPKTENYTGNENAQPESVSLLELAAKKQKGCCW